MPDVCARCNAPLTIGASRCNDCRQWLCDPCVNQHDCENTMTNEPSPSFVPPPVPNTIEELARFVVDAVREGSNTAGRMRAFYNHRFKNSIRYPVMERAIQFARKADWIRFSHNKWRLHRPPGATEGIRVVITLEIPVPDLDHYDANTIEDAGEYLQHQIDQNDVGLHEVVDFASRVVSVVAEGRRDLLPFRDDLALNATGGSPSETSGNTGNNENTED